MKSYCFGIDVGGTTIKCGLFLSDGTLLEKWVIPTRLDDGGDYILPDIAKTVNEKIEAMGIDKSTIDGVGIGIPGPVNARGEVPLAVNLHWHYKAVSSELSALTGLKSKAANDANVAAYGEAWKGAGAGNENVIMLTLGTGVGGGIIVDGKIITGAHGCGGEVGHASVNPDEEEACNCGNHGCLEQYCSATGIVRLARKELASSSKDSLLRNQFEVLSARKVLDAFKEGDELATAVVDRVCRILGQALSGFAAVIDPDCIVIGGGVSKAGRPFISLIEKYFHDYAFSPCKDTSVVEAMLGNDAGIYGAARLVISEPAEQEEK